MFQISTVQTLSYRSHMINAWSWSIKISEKRPKVRPGCICLFVCLFFSNKSRATSNVIIKKDILSSALDMTKFVRCHSETCFRNAHFSKRHTMPIWNMFQDGTCFRAARTTRAQKRCTDMRTQRPGDCSDVTANLKSFRLLANTVMYMFSQVVVIICYLSFPGKIGRSTGEENT